MKKLLPAIVLFFTAQTASAQYHPLLGDTTEWCQVLNAVPLRAGDFSEYHFEAQETIVIGSHAYKKVSSNVNPNVGALREDSAAQKVYFVKPGDTAGILLYDFTMTLGDTIDVDFDISAPAILLDGHYIVDSVATVSIRGGLRKYLRLYNPLNPGGSNARRLEWIEGVGDLHFPIYIYADETPAASPGASSCGEEYIKTVIKHERNHVRDYVSTCLLTYAPGFISADTCQVDIVGAVNAFMGQEPQLFVYPNPSNGQNLHINLPAALQNGPLALSLTDARGRIVYTLQWPVQGTGMPFSAPQLQPGLYLLRVQQAGGASGTCRLLIE